MNRALSFTLAWFLVAVGPAWGLTDDQQKCLGTFDKGFRANAVSHSRAQRACLKKNARDKLATSLEECLDSPVPERKRRKAGEAFDRKFDKHCTGVDDAGTDRLPAFGLTAPGGASFIARGSGDELIEALFGSDLASALSREKPVAKCQDLVFAMAGKCRDAMLRSYHACKKDALENGVDSPQGLEPCVFLSESKLAKACDDPKPDKIRKTLQKKCVDAGVELTDAFPGCAESDVEGTHACVHRHLTCGTCLAINAVDDLQRDCDLVDDGDDNGSCATTWFGMSQEPIGAHTSRLLPDAFCASGPRAGEPCTDVDNGFWTDCNEEGEDEHRCKGISRTLAVSRGAPDGILFPLPARTSIDCGVVDPETGIAECECNLVGIEPVLGVKGIGVICTEPLRGCAKGTIDCDGGSPGDVEQVANHNIGTCGLGDDPNETAPLGQADCAENCSNYCDGLGEGFDVVASSCEGYCLGGERDGRFCELAVECPGGMCAKAGIGAAAHPNRCNCVCARVTGAARRPGSFTCQTGVRAVLESSLPCGDEPESLVIGQTCGTTTTETANSVILGQDNTLGMNLVGGTLVGEPPICSLLAADARNPRANTRSVGHRAFIDALNINDRSVETIGVTVPDPDPEP